MTSARSPFSGFHALLAVLGVGAITLGCQKTGGVNAVGSGPPPGIQVVAVPTLRQPVVETVSLAASVAPNEIVEVRAEADGIVREILFSEGQPVAQGEILVRLDESKLLAQLNEAEAGLKLAHSSYDRVAQLLRDKLISQQEFDQAAATFSVNEAGVQLKRRLLVEAKVAAPFSGTVGARQISPGQVITRNTPLTSLVDLSQVKVEIGVPEKYLSQVKVGQTIAFQVAAYPNETFKGEVYFIAPQLDIATRTALVKARIANADGRLKGGMFASLNLNLQLRDQALVIPEPAIVNSGDATSVFAVDAATNAVFKTVKLGLRLAGVAEVLEGLREGEMVVVEGVQKLRPGAAVRLAPKEASAPYRH